MTPENFLRFVYNNFYKTQWLSQRAFFDALPRDARQSTVTDDERQDPHVAWRR
jgi:hypothetical protein